MTPSISYIIPTRNRLGELRRTLDAIGDMGRHDAEVIVVDNASATRPHVPAHLASGVPTTLLQRTRNEGAAARNIAARAASGRWLVMLDDDSHPTCTGDEIDGALGSQPSNVGAVMGDIRLPGPGRREAGGLPEVFVGCGVAIRRDVFLDLGGYDRSFGYYAEEYDLAARMLLDGLRVGFDPVFSVDHRKVVAGRNMDLILERLVRNNAWVMQRYAPEAVRRKEIRHIRARYRSIAIKEHALGGFGRGLVELRDTIAAQPRREMPQHAFDRFTGLAAARQAIALALAQRPGAIRSATIVAHGKNESVVRHAIAEAGIALLDSPDAEAAADMLVIGTLSPGPMIDAALARPVDWASGRLVLPWTRAALAIDRPKAPAPARAA
ncbi:MAG: glycosyltransferase [Phycisphaeraceae bacterium]|nr:glycosyltransferase [Phycisphaeraceae bacterium]